MLHCTMNSKARARDEMGLGGQEPDMDPEKRWQVRESGRIWEEGRQGVGVVVGKAGKIDAGGTARAFRRDGTRTREI